MKNSGCGRAVLFGGLAVLAVLVLVAVGAVYIVRSIKVAAVHRPGGRDDVSIQIPGGRLEVRGHEKLNLATMGVTVYPDARPANNKGGGATFEWNSDDGKKDKAIAVAGADYITSDPPEMVFEWYRSHLPGWEITPRRNGSGAHFALNRDGYKRVIAIRAGSDGTHISVATVGVPESN